MYYVLWRHHILPTGTFPCCAFVKIVGLSHILGRIIPDGHSTASVNVVKCDLKKRNRTMVAGRLNNIYFVGRDIRFVSKLNRDSEQRVRSGMGAYAGAGRRRVHLAAVLLRPPSGHRPSRRQAHHAHIFHESLSMVRSSDLDEKEFDRRDPPQGVAPHARRGVVLWPVGQKWRARCSNLTRERKIARTIPKPYFVVLPR